MQKAKKKSIPEQPVEPPNPVQAEPEPAVQPEPGTHIGGVINKQENSKRKKKKKNQKSTDELFKLRTHANRTEWYKYLAEEPYHEVILSTTPVDKQHPWAHIIKADYCIAANGVPGDPIFLSTGRRYSLSLVHEAKCQIILTFDPRGGSESGRVPKSHILKPGSSLIFRATPDFPTIMYYQDDKHTFLGGLIIHENDHDDHCSTCSGTLSDNIKSGEIETKFN